VKLHSGPWDARGIFERFTNPARAVLRNTQHEPRLLGHPFIDAEHILLGLLDEEESVAAEALARLGITIQLARGKVEETVAWAGDAIPGSPPCTPRAKKVFELALREALQLGHRSIGTEHLLLGLVREGDGVGAWVLVSLGSDLNSVRQKVYNPRVSTNQVRSLLPVPSEAGCAALVEESHRAD